MILSNKTYLPYLALTAAAIIWGANTPIMKYTLSFVPVFTLAFLRFFFASMLLLPFVFKQIHFEKKDWFHLFLSAFLGLTVNLTLYFVGLTMTSALNTGIIGGTLPIVTLFFAYVFLSEKVSRRMIIGSAISLLGLCVIIGKDILLQGLDISPLGDAMIFISNIAFASYITLSKGLTPRYKPLVLTFFIFFVGSIFFIPGVAFEYGDNPTWISHIPVLAIGGIFYGIIFSALIAFSLWQYGISKVQETQLGLFLYISPLISSLLAICVLGENLSEEFLIGTLLIFIGLFIAEAHLRHKKSLHHAS